LDLAFNAAANGLTTASIQAIMAKMATDDPEAIGSAFGGGLLFGGAIPVGQTPGQLNRLPNGNIDAAFMRVQNDLAHSKALEILKEKDKSAYDLFNQLAASGVESNIFLFDKQTFKDHFRADVGENANGRGFWEDENGDMYIDVQSKDGVPKMVQELGVRISRDLLDKSPELKRRVKEELDPDGALDINEVADRFIQDRMKSVLTGKLTGSTVRSKFSKDPDTLRLVEFTTEALLNKLGILDASGNVRDNLSDSQVNILTNNEFVRNANNNLNVIRAARRAEGNQRDLDIQKEKLIERQESAYEDAYNSHLVNVNNIIDVNNTQRGKINEMQNAYSAIIDDALFLKNQDIAIRDEIRRTYEQAGDEAFISYQEEKARILQEQQALANALESAVDEANIQSIQRRSQELARQEALADANQAAREEALIIGLESKSKALTQQEKIVKASMEASNTALADSIDAIINNQRERDIATTVSQSLKEKKDIERAQKFIDNDVFENKQIMNRIDDTVGINKFAKDKKSPDGFAYEKYVTESGMVKSRRKLNPFAKAWQNKKSAFVDVAQMNNSANREVGAGKDSTGIRIGLLRNFFKGKRLKFIDDIQKSIDNGNAIDFLGAKVGVKQDGGAGPAGTLFEPLNWRVGKVVKDATTLLEIQGIDRNAAMDRLIEKGLPIDDIKSEISEVRDFFKMGADVKQITEAFPRGRNSVVDLMREDIQVSNIGQANRVYKSFDPHYMSKVKVIP